MSHGESKGIMHNQNLTVSLIAGTDTDYGNTDGSGNLCGKLLRHTFKNNH